MQKIRKKNKTEIDQKNQNNEENKKPKKQKYNVQFGEEPVTRIKIIDPNTKHNTTEHNKRFDELSKNLNVEIINEGDETKNPNSSAKPKKSAFKTGKNINTHDEEIKFGKNKTEDDYDYVYSEKRDINWNPQGQRQSPERIIKSNENDITKKMSRGMLENANENTQKNLMREKNSITKSVGLEKGVYKDDATQENKKKLKELNKQWNSDEYTPKKWEKKERNKQSERKAGSDNLPSK